jgi:hypothetical protein
MMKLVENWTSAWKFISVQLAIIAAALQGAVLAFPDLDKWLGDTNTHWVGLVMLLSIVFGRVIDQNKPAT